MGNGGSRKIAFKIYRPLVVKKSTVCLYKCIYFINSHKSESWGSESTLCNLSGNSLFGGRGVFPGITMFNPGQSLYSTPAQFAWHLFAKSLFPSKVQTGRNIWLHFFPSQLSHDPLLGKLSEPISSASVWILLITFSFDFYGIAV